MASPRVFTWPLLILNSLLHIIVLILAAWALHNTFINTKNATKVTGNITVTRYFLVFALVAGAVGMGSMLSGLDHITTWTLESFSSSAAVSAMSLILTFEALGFASKEIHEGVFRHTALKALEIIAIIVGASQLIYTIVLQLAKIQGEFL